LVLDSGITGRPEEFQDRVVKLPDSNFVTTETHDDILGHGTYVAGILGSTTYGAAKNITIFDIKIQNEKGDISADDIVGAIGFVRFDSLLPERQAQCPKGFVVNMSYGTSIEGANASVIASAQVVNDNIQLAISQPSPPLAVFVAAGNENHPSTLTSPGNIPDACTIGNTDRNDFIFRGQAKNGNPHFAASNYGPGVDLFAPGSAVISTTNEIGPFGNFSASPPWFCSAIEKKLTILA